MCIYSFILFYYQGVIYLIIYLQFYSNKYKDFINNMKKPNNGGDNSNFSLSGIILGNKAYKRNYINDDKIKLLENELLKANKIIREKDYINYQLKLDIEEKENKLTKSGEKIAILENEVKSKNIEIKRLKIDLKVKMEEDKNNKLINIKFQSSDGVINTTISSFENDKFNILEEKLYVEFEKYRDTNNLFLVNGNQVLRFKTLKENKIRDGQVIIMNVFDDN